MSTRPNKLALWVMACAWGAAAAAVDTAPRNALRVVDIQPSVFDYLLTGLSGNVAGVPRLSFNDRIGNTWFRRPGEHVGAYRIESFAIRTNRAFNSSVNAMQETRVVSAVLAALSGATNLTLVQGERLPWPGWTARLVSLDTGVGWAVRQADAFVIDDTTVRVASVTATSVTVVAVDPAPIALPVRIPVPDLTDTDRAALAQRWADNAKRRQAARAAAEPPEPPEPPTPPERVAKARPFNPIGEPAPSLHTALTIPSQPPMAIGSVFSYPTEFTVIPAVWDLSGHLISDRVVVPRHFEPFYSGYGKRSQSRF